MVWRIVLLGATIGVVASSQSESCATDAPDQGVGSSLLQAKSESVDRRRYSIETAARTEKKTLGLLSSSHHTHQAHSKVQYEHQGTARATLPPHLFEIGMQYLQTEQVLDSVVANTVEHQQVYAGVNMKIRMVLGDAVDGTDAYGLSTLGQTYAATPQAQSEGGMMSMIDIGGNYGRVSIAAFKLHPQNLRIIAVEPVPSTYFLLRWNLWLNDVPEIELQEFYFNRAKVGVIPLNHGIENIDEKVTGFCYSPPRTMQARVCDCAKAAPGEFCNAIVSKSLNTLVSMLGGQAVTFLKVDCEGCEVDVIPSLMNLQATGLRVHRLAGELHAMPNEIEDYACQAEGGAWFVSICFQQGVVQTLGTKDRCTRGPARESCSRISYADLRDKRPPPSEW